MFVPFPSCPRSPFPQHHTLPFEITAPVKSPADADTPTAPRRTSVGSEVRELVPRPTSPDPFLPQQMTAPSACSAHACPPPALTLTLAFVPSVRAVRSSVFAS